MLITKSSFILLLEFSKHIKKRRKLQLMILLILMFFTSFLEVASIGILLPFLGILTSPASFFKNEYLQPLIKILDITSPTQLLLPLTIIFSVIILLAGFTRVLFVFLQTRISYAIGADISINIYRRTLFQPYLIHISRNSSEIISGISNKANSIITNTVLPFLTICNSLLMIVMIVITLFIIHPLAATSAFFGFGIIYFVIVKIANKQIEKDGYNVNIYTTQVVKALQEGLGGIRDVLLDGTQDVYCEIYRKADAPLRKSQSNLQIISNSPRFLIESFAMVLIAVLAYFLASQEGGVATAIPILGSLALGAQRLLPVLQQAYSSWATLLGSSASLESTIELLNQPIFDDRISFKSQSIGFKNDIVLESVSFKYSNDTPFVLKDISIKIPKGACIGFIGTTGSGKSTLLDIIMGLLEPTKGRLLIDDVEISDSNRNSWQSHIAHVPQTIFLADTTIAENIAFGIPLDEIDYDRVIEASKKAQINTFIDTLDKKFMTKVGERGVRLSGGQRQRIGIARALYKKADIIIFDEATSALDNTTETSVMDSIENLSSDLTILIVAHRISTLKKCSQIINIENGLIHDIETLA